MENDTHRPWGYFEVLLSEPTHKVKQIVVYPGKRLSLQRHTRRSEHWFIVTGSAVVTVGDDEIPVDSGRAVDIPCGARHRLENIGSENVVFIEVQTGEYFGEDDIERLEDDFGRI